MGGQQTVIPQGLEPLKTKIDQLNNLSFQIQAKITKISVITQSTNPNSNRKNQGSTSIVNILTNYKNYVDYLKNILEVKFKKDDSIIKLQTNVFSKIQPIIEILNKNKNLGVIEKSKELNNLQRKRNQLITTRNTLSKSNKRYLVDINPELLKTKYKLHNGEIVEDNGSGTDLITLINQHNLTNCNVRTLQNDLNNAVSSYDEELKNISTSTGGATKNVPTIEKTDGDLFKALNNDEVISTNTIVDKLNNTEKINKINVHTNKLKDIKYKYENGLKENIEEFKKICKALQELITATTEICTTYTEQIKSIKQQNKRIKEDQKDAITNLNEEISKISGEIQSIKKGEANITLLGLNISNLENIENVFKTNKEALENIMQEIKTQQINVNSINDNITGTSNTSSSSGTSNSGSTGTSGTSGTGSNITSGNSGYISNGSNGSNGSNSSNSNGSEISVGIQEFLEGFKAIKLNNDEKIEIENVQQQIDEKLVKLKVLKDKENRSNDDNTAITTLEDEIEELFQGSNFTITDKMQNALDSIPERNLTEEQRKLVFNYIGLLTYNKDFEKGLRVLERDNAAKNLLEQIFKETDDRKRHNLLLELYEKRPNRKEGGKYKMKKSKKSKSKTTKTTPKKAKSTKKPRTTRTQTKSYNNPKYKNQDGGFVRGGVLFPESFYRSDIVM